MNTGLTENAFIECLYTGEKGVVDNERKVKQTMRGSYPIAKYKSVYFKVNFYFSSKEAQRLCC